MVVNTNSSDALIIYTVWKYMREKYICFGYSQTVKTKLKHLVEKIVQLHKMLQSFFLNVGGIYNGKCEIVLKII